MAVQSGNQVSSRLLDFPIDTEIMTKAIIQRAIETNAFINSGVLVRDQVLDEFLNGGLGGETISVRYVGPLQQDDANISNDNPADKSTPKKLTGGKNTAVRQSLNQSWSSMDIVSKLLGVDPLRGVSDGMGDYWSGQLTRRTVASTIGVFASDQASGSPELSVDISGESDTASIFNPKAFIDAKNTMGDQASNLTAIAMHSVVYGTIEKQNLIDFIPFSESKLPIPTYMGLPIIVDDALTPVITTTTTGEGQSAVTTTKTQYYTILFGRGAFALGVGAAKVPFEIARDAAAGNGGGEEVWHNRLEWAIHPQGFSFELNKTPTLAQLCDGTNWTMNFERKRIPLAALITAG